jgi:uncharacterized membrane protein
MKKPEYLVLLIALLAMAAKLYCAFTTVGTIDVLLFRDFARGVSDLGVVGMYNDPTFNHPPLLGTYLGFIHDWAVDQPLRFPAYLRLPTIVADLLTVLVMLWVRRKTGRPSWWALGLLAASPISFMVSGYHGNFDGLIALGVALTAAACVGEQPMACGLLLGLTCQVKIIPALLGPIFFFYWLHRGKGRQFAIGIVSIVVAGWMVPLCAAPVQFLKHVIAYNSVWGWWGLSYLIHLMGGPGVAPAPTSPRTVLEIALTLAFKVTIVAGVIILAWKRRKVRSDEVFATVAFAWAIFLVMAPGFGVQYLVWISPVLLMHSERWFAAYTAAASSALFVFYNTVSFGMPWNRGFHLGSTMNQWEPWLLLPWGVLLALLAASTGAWRGSEQTMPAESLLPAAASEPISDAH